MWYENTAIVAGVSSIITLVLPKMFGYLTRRHAEIRAATLKEIAARTDVMDRQVARLDAEVIRLTDRNEMMSIYICDLEAELRNHDLPVPDPPWALRRSDGYKRPGGNT